MLVAGQVGFVLFVAGQVGLGTLIGRAIRIGRKGLNDDADRQGNPDRQERIE